MMSHSDSKHSPAATATATAGATGDVDETNVEKFETFFAEASEVMALINDFTTGTTVSDESIVTILEKYQEQPELLDSHLEAMVSPLMQIVRQQHTSTPLLHRCFKIVYCLCKVRGYKTVGM
jgi:tubulin-specific chaperone D